MILFFGLLRPYKGLDTLLEAYAGIEGAELWIVGNPRMDLGPLRAAAARARGPVRFVTRFVEDAEVPAILRRADLLVLPYRDAEQSGVLYTGLAFGKAMVLSEVGGFPEVAAHGAARLVPPEDPRALAAVLEELVGDEPQRRALGEAAAAAAAGPYSWDTAAEKTLELYEELLEARSVTLAAILFWVSVALIAYTHLGYPLLLRLLVRFRKPPAYEEIDPPPKVSLIIAAHDEEDVIAAKVANALALSYPRELLEVIVASDGSDDETAERAREAGADLVLELPRGGKTAAQNAAAERAEGEILAFSDANSVWSPDALRSLVEPFADPTRRLRLRPGPVPLARGRQPRGRLLALRDGGP